MACGQGGGKGTKGFCKELIECEGGNDADLKWCVEDWEFKKESAAAYGCKDEYTAFRDCMVDNSVCDTAGSSYVLQPDTACDAVESNLDDCKDAASRL